jgi:hypothetical protein
VKILFLDDDEQRHDLFQRETIGHDVRHVRTVEQCIKALAEFGPYDAASLDHDLGGQHYATGPGHGFDVAEFLAMNVALAPPRVVVHSYNEAGAKAMLAVMARAGIPCAWFPFFEWKPSQKNALIK